MNDPRHLLILTSKTGGGHVSLAESLADILADDFTSSVIDPQPRWIHRHYQLVSRYALWLWSAEFQLSNTPGRASRAHKLFSGLIRSRLRMLIAQEQPAAVLSTYPFFSYSVQKIAPQMPLVLLYSDPRTLHSAWLTVKNAALHLAPSREVYAQALAAQVQPDKTHLIGWPTRRQFYAPDPAAAESAWAETGFNRERLTIFLQGGGEGSAGFARTVERLLSLTDSHGQPALQLILATGTNQLLQRRFQGRRGCRVLPFTKLIAPWMACADLVMGKAGPNMLFESVTLGKPFLATTFIPGQEEGNLEMIRDYGLGWVALTGEEQIRLIQRLLHQPEALREKQATVEAYRAWNQAGIAKVPSLIQTAITKK